MTLTDLCKELNNWFDVSKYFNIFEIKDGKIDLSGLLFDGSLQKNQYFRIIGSIFNDGVYQYSEDLTFENDEVFNGAVWAMAVPPTVIELLTEITEWIDKYNDVLNSPFQRESFGGYSYSKASAGSRGDGSSSEISWQSHFINKLNKWRKV